MIVPRLGRSSPIRGDGGAAAKALDEAEDAGDEIERLIDDLGTLVDQACTPPSASGARSANQAAKELLEQRKTIHEQERLVTSLRSDLAARGQSLLRSEDKRRGLEGALADLRMKLHEIETKAARADARAGRARDFATGALADKELAVQRGEDAVRRLEQRHARDLASERARIAQEIAERVERATNAQQIEVDERVAEAQRLEATLGAERRAHAAERQHYASELAERDRALAELFEQQERVLTEQERAHRAEIAACERLVAIAAAGAVELERTLAAEREALAASVAAHARALVSGEEKRDRAVAERDREHVLANRAAAQAHRKELAERCAKAEEVAQARAATAHARVASTMNARLRDVEQSLAESRSKHARELTDLKLQVAGLRESAAAERRLAQHAIEMHARARAEVAEVCRALEAAEREAVRRELARDDALSQLDQYRACARDTLDESGVRLACAQEADDDDDEAEDEVTTGDRLRRASGP